MRILKIAQFLAAIFVVCIVFPSSGVCTTELSSQQSEMGADETVTAEPATDEEPEQGIGQQAAPVESTVTRPEGVPVVRVSVLGRFRRFRGEKNIKSLVALFDSDPTPGVRQEPAVILSNGVMTVRVFIDLPSRGNQTPNFALKGAELVSLEKEGETLVMELLPDRDVLEANVNIFNNGIMTVIPLTVAPPMDDTIDPAVVPGEKEFNLFLKERGTDKVPLFDLNKDGKRDYVDDYIFTANYIVRRDSVKNVKPAEKIDVDGGK